MAHNNHLIIFFFSVSFLISQINSKCSMAQDPDGIPRPAYENETEPHTEHGEDSYCQDFVGQKTCCTAYQIGQIVKNFDALESIFGGDGGCDVCVVNLKRFWCHFTCSPNQAEFIEVNNLTTYIIDGQEHLLRDINYLINDDTNCNLFKSCKKTKFVAQVPSMGNAIGFTNFQGINAYTKTPAYVTMIIDNNRGLKYDIDDCALNVPDTGKIRGYKATNCTCNSCDGKCDYDLDASVPYMNGANIGLIIGCYIFVFLATLGLFFYKKTMGKSSGNDGARPSDIRYSELEN